MELVDFFFVKKKLNEWFFELLVKDSSTASPWNFDIFIGDWKGGLIGHRFGTCSHFTGSNNMCGTKDLYCTTQTPQKTQNKTKNEKEI